ncbi:MAG: hypothetical protein K0B05_07610 [Bacteroidales bacterium]|nr:hypothetical protein [Bacteroidales bacterium]
MRPLVKKAISRNRVPLLNLQHQDKFWTNTSGSYKIDTESLLKFLNNRGYYVYWPYGAKTIILIKIDNKIVKEVTAKEIRRFCWDYIENEYHFSDPDERKQVKAEFYKSQYPVSKNNLELLPVLDLAECKDTKDKSYLFFNDCALEVTKDSIQMKNYADIEGIVFQSDICNINIRSLFTRDQVRIESIKPEGEFHEFIKDLCRNDLKNVNSNSYESLVTIIGYLIHRYKDPGNTFAVIFMDTYKDGTPNGGTGKGVLTKGLAKVRKTAFQNGKCFRSSDKFALSNVQYGTRLLRIDDVPRDFDFEKIFPLITEDAVIERKHENKFVIPFEISPKVMITTNFVVEGKGDSHNRRKIEFILSKVFHPEYTPENKFGHLLYDEWDETEWLKFYMVIAYGIQEYLKKGIVKPKFNVAERKLKMEATPEFIEFVNNSVNPGEKMSKNRLYETFYEMYPNHHKIELTTFRHWLKYFADAYGYKFYEKHSGNDNKFEFC